VIDAPPERVWAALADPEALLAWLPPGEMTGRFERFDARPGGSYRMVLTYPDASGAPGKATVDSDIVEARFVYIVPGERVGLMFGLLVGLATELQSGLQSGAASRARGRAHGRARGPWH
jgi:uncharacterized protein YndB with AHSA1/START domain